MIINRNTLGHLENPDFILVKASEERVGVLQCTSKNWNHKYNDLDTLSFEIPYMADGKITPFYDQIDAMKYIEVPTVGRFSIKDIETLNEGQKNEYKKVECQDYSSILGTQYLEEFEINTGLTGAIDGVKFYQPGDQTHSLLHLCLEKFPEWQVDYVAPSLWSMQRSFEVTRQDVYGFLTGDCSEAFECIFTFNSLNKTINVYNSETFGQDTNIHVSYNNLLQKTTMNYSTDDIKTCLTLKGDDDLNIREIAMGYDRIYSLDYYASEEYMSQSLFDAYHAWKELVDTLVDTSLFTYKAGVITQAELQGKSYKEAFTYLLTKYQNYYTNLSKWYNTLLPYLVTTRNRPGYGTVSFTEDGSDAVTFDRQTATAVVSSLPSSKNDYTLYILRNSSSYEMYRWSGSKWVNVNDWHDIALAELKSLQASAENLQAVAMKAGYGDKGTESYSYSSGTYFYTYTTARYADTYLPAYYMYNALQKQIDIVNATISSLESDQAIIERDKNIISTKTDMKNNFTTTQLKELSTFIREDELSSSNYVVTDTMTEDERFEMLYALLAYGEKELAKVSTPQIQFSADLVNLFAIPEFDMYSGDFDVGNYVWVTIRDDYSIKAKILEISINFLDQSDFSVTFGNVLRRSRNIFTDVTNAINAATSAATSVSFSSSHWSAAAQETDSIGKALSEGLLSQGYYLANAENNDIHMDKEGLWITTSSGPHGRENTDNYDSIYLGGGRILYTSDGWRTVAMSAGRADVQMPTINTSGTQKSLIYTTESKFGVFADFVIAGYVGGSTIVGGDIYSSNYKTNSGSVVTGNAGAHINLTDGTFEFNAKSSGKKRLVLSNDNLTVYGTIQATSGHIGCADDGTGGFVIESNKLYNGKSAKTTDSTGVYIGTDGISLGRTTSYPGESYYKSAFQVDSDGTLYAGSANIKGRITASSGTIGGFTIGSSAIYNGKSSYDADSYNGVYLGTDGIALGSSGDFKVSNSGYLTAKYGSIGGATISSSSIYASNGDWKIQSNGIAYFYDVYITNVRSGSTFGGVTTNGGDYTYYDSDYYSPFQGNCINHIERISADYIETNYLYAMRADIDNLWAEKATVSELDAAVARIRSIESDYVTAYELDTHRINANYITSGTINTNRLDIDGIVYDMQGKDFNINGLEVHGYIEYADWLVTWQERTISGTTIRYLGR